MERYKLSSHSVYNINYHLVWCPKRRKSVLLGNIAEKAKELFREKAKELGVTIETMEVMPDHVHLFVSSKPNISPHKIIKIMKGYSSRVLRQIYPNLLKLPTLWSHSYYCGTVGCVSDTVVRNYIENQKGK